MIFETVNEINEAIKAINYASYLIRLCALNSQISIARISYHTKKSTGFTPISVELIRITEEAKVSRNKALQEKFFREYKSEFGERKFELTHLEKKIFFQYDEKVDELKKSFHIQFTSFRSIIKETIKLCKNSRPIVFSVKIESVYIENHQAAFDELSVELSNFISKIESILKKIELLNLELIEDK